MANYPTSLPSASPGFHSGVNDEIVAIGTELGLNPKGSYASVLARLAQAGDVHYGDPRQHDLLAWTYDPVAGSGGALAPISGLQYFFRVRVPRTVTFTNVWWETAVVGAALTAGANNLALYDSTGARIAETADQTTNYTTLGIKTVAFTAPVAVTGGPTVFVWIGYKSTGTTPVGWRNIGPPNSALSNVNQTTANYRCFTNGTNTAALMPATITLAASVMSAAAPWLALS